MTPAEPGHRRGCWLGFWDSHIHKAISRLAWGVGKTWCYPPDGKGAGREREVVASQQVRETPGELLLVQPEAGEKMPARDRIIDS